MRALRDLQKLKDESIGNLMFLAFLVILTILIFLGLFGPFIYEGYRVIKARKDPVLYEKIQQERAQRRMLGRIGEINMWAQWVRDNREDSELVIKQWKRRENEWKLEKERLINLMKHKEINNDRR